MVGGSGFSGFSFSVKSGGAPHHHHHHTHTGSQLGCLLPVPTGDADMFGTTSAPSLKEPQKPEQLTPGKSSYLPVPTGLFDDDDDDDDFFAASSGKPSKTGTCSSLFLGIYQKKNIDLKRT